MVPLDRIIALISFWSNIKFTFYYTRVQPQCDFSILERIYICIYIYIYIYTYTCIVHPRITGLFYKQPIKIRHQTGWAFWYMLSNSYGMPSISILINGIYIHIYTYMPYIYCNEWDGPFDTCCRARIECLISADSFPANTPWD